MKMTKAFTMIELIFVIVILGILAAVALPKFAETGELADIAKGRADVATIRAAIVNERQSRLILGDSDYIDKLSSGDVLFTGDTSTDPDRVLLTYGIKAGTGSGDWAKVNDTTYTYKVGGTTTTFTYDPDDNGKFTCVADSTGTDSQKLCAKLVN